MPLGTGRKSSAGEDAITPFVIAAYATGYLALIAGWLKGGHPERFGATVLLLDCLAGNLGEHWQFRDPYMDSLTQDLAVMVIFGWLALRADRWWPIAVTASLALTILVRIIGMSNPDMSKFAMLSAVLGFWLFLYTVMLAGVVERRLAGRPRSAKARPGVADSRRGPPIVPRTPRSRPITPFLIAAYIRPFWPAYGNAVWRGRRRAS